MKYEAGLWLLVILCVFGTIWGIMINGYPSSEHKAKMEELKEQAEKARLIDHLEQDKAYYETVKMLEELTIKD
jgi:hypothetical protein